MSSTKNFRTLIEASTQARIAELKDKLRSCSTAALILEYQLRMSLTRPEKKESFPDGFAAKWKYVTALALTQGLDKSLSQCAAELPKDVGIWIDRQLEQLYDSYSSTVVFTSENIRELLTRMTFAASIREARLQGFPEQIKDWALERFRAIDEVYFVPNFGVSSAAFFGWIDKIADVVDDRFNAAGNEMKSIMDEMERLRTLSIERGLSLEQIRAQPSAIRLGQRLDANKTAIASLFTFSESELLNLAPASLKREVLNILSLPLPLSSPFFPHDANPLDTAPFVRSPSASFELMWPTSMLHSSITALELDVAKWPPIQTRFLKARDVLLERRVKKGIAGVLPGCEIFSNYCLEPGTSEKDLWVRFGRTLLLIECKNTRLRMPDGRPGDVELVSDDFTRSIQLAFDQALAVKELIALGKPCQFYKLNGQKYFSLEPNSIDEMFIICITVNLGTSLVIDLSHFLTKPPSEPYPIAWNLHDFETICKYLGSPEKLFPYLRGRQSLHGRVIAGDELDFAGYYFKVGNLDFGKARVLQGGFSKVFDRAWYREKGVEYAEPQGPPVLSSMRRVGNRITMAVEGERPHQESFRIEPKTLEMITKSPTREIKGRERNLPCRCGSGIKAKNCCAR